MNEHNKGILTPNQVKKMLELDGYDNYKMNVKYILAHDAALRAALQAVKEPMSDKVLTLEQLDSELKMVASWDDEVSVDAAETIKAHDAALRDEIKALETKLIKSDVCPDNISEKDCGLSPDCISCWRQRAEKHKRAVERLVDKLKDSCPSDIDFDCCDLQKFNKQEDCINCIRKFAYAEEPENKGE